MGRYLVGQSLRAGGEAYEEVLGSAGRYRQVAENLRVKEVTVGEGERRRRYALCCNPEEAGRQKRHRERVLAELEAELASLAEALQRILPDATLADFALLTLAMVSTAGRAMMTQAQCRRTAGDRRGSLGAVA